MFDNFHFGLLALHWIVVVEVEDRMGRNCGTAKEDQ